MYCFSDSGMGDHEEEGINSFLNDHECTDVCIQLQLDTVMPLAGPVGDAGSPGPNEDVPEEQK